MSKNMIYGAGMLGIIAAAIYIYKEHKKAKEAEAESVVNIDSEEGTEETTKEQKKEVITEKVTSLGRKIGKTLGTTALKFGAKHPKITKFILKFGRYIPYALIGIAVLASLPFYNRARDFMEGVDPDSINVTDDGIEFTRYLPKETEPRKMAIERSDEKLPTNGWDEKYRKNYDAVVAFANTLNLYDGEMFIIEDQKKYINDNNFPTMDKDHPIVSHLVNYVGVYPEETL